MQNARPKRRFFQLHLSTALALMVLAAGLLGANLIPRKKQINELPFSVQGWPFVFEMEAVVSEFKANDIIPLRIDHFGGGRVAVSEWHVENPRECIASNIAVALGILTLAGAVMEWRLRRRDNYKETSHG